MGFSAFRYETIKIIRARADAYDAEFRRKAKVALCRILPSERVIAQYDGLVGGSADFIDMRKTTAANGQARNLLRKRLIKRVRRIWRTTRSIDFYFGTLIHSDWDTDSSNTIIPLADMQDRVRNTLRLCGFRGCIMMLEIQAIPGRPTDQSWKLFPHCHFLGWADRTFNKAVAGKRVRDSKRLTSSSGAKTFILSKKIIRKSDLFRRVAYLVKEPYSGKKVHKKTGRFERTIQEMHPDICLRLTEILSYVRLSELLMLTGDATKLRKGLLSHAVARRESNTGPQAPRYPANFWDIARSNAGPFFLPTQVIRKPRSSRSSRS